METVVKVEMVVVAVPQQTLYRTRNAPARFQIAGHPARPILIVQISAYAALTDVPILALMDQNQYVIQNSITQSYNSDFVVIYYSITTI